MSIVAFIPVIAILLSSKGRATATSYGLVKIGQGISVEAVSRSILEAVVPFGGLSGGRRCECTGGEGAALSASGLDTAPAGSADAGNETVFRCTV